jgi:hypothetical protein
MHGRQTVLYKQHLQNCYAILQVYMYGLYNKNATSPLRAHGLTDE